MNHISYRRFSQYSDDPAVVYTLVLLAASSTLAIVSDRAVRAAVSCIQDRAIAGRSS